MNRFHHAAPTTARRAIRVRLPALLDRLHELDAIRAARRPVLVDSTKYRRSHGIPCDPGDFLE
jgi:hypothetical protein